MTISSLNSAKYLVLLMILLPRVSPNSACQLSIVDNGKLYDYNLASPTSDFPHGVLSEDGFYKVAVNETVLWFQLCYGMIFNHNPPACVDCSDCGGPSRCGMGCSALVSDKVKGYHVCTTVGRASDIAIDLIDHKNPHIGVIVKMLSSGDKRICSLSASIICDSNGFQGPHLLEKSGFCDYSTVLRHPSACANIVPVHGEVWGWLSTFLTILLCLLGAYLLAGTVYRYFFLKVRGVEVIPNLEFWTSVPHRTQSSFTSLVRRFKGPRESHRNSYSPVNF